MLVTFYYSISGIFKWCIDFKVFNFQGEGEWSWARRASEIADFFKAWLVRLASKYVRI